MSNLASKNVLSTPSVGASETNLPISFTFQISGEDSKSITLDLIYDNATAAVGITAKLQSSPDGVNWIDSKTVAITGAVATTTVKSIELIETRAGDQAFMPLRKFCRVVVTSGAGDSVTFSACHVSSKQFAN